jgi:hypothetical protein
LDWLDPAADALKQGGAVGASQCSAPIMEETMAQGLENEWEKELRVLLELVKSHPSADMSRERERIAVLKNLMATHQASATQPPPGLS